MSKADGFSRSNSRPIPCDDTSSKLRAPPFAADARNVHASSLVTNGTSHAKLLKLGVEVSPDAEIGSVDNVDRDTVILLNGAEYGRMVLHGMRARDSQGHSR